MGNGVTPVFFRIMRSSHKELSSIWICHDGGYVGIGYTITPPLKVDSM